MLGLSREIDSERYAALQEEVRQEIVKVLTAKALHWPATEERLGIVKEALTTMWEERYRHLFGYAPPLPYAVELDKEKGTITMQYRGNDAKVLKDWQHASQ